MVKPVELRYPSSFLHEELLDRLFPIFDKEGKASVDLLIEAHKNMINYINYLVDTNQKEEYKLLMNVMYNDYLTFMDYSKEPMFSNYLLGCSSFEELIDRLEENPQEVLTLISAFTSYHQIEKHQKHLPYRHFEAWTLSTAYEKQLSEYIMTDEYQEEYAMLEVLSNPSNLPSFTYLLENEETMIYDNKDFILNAIYEYYRVNLTLHKLGAALNDDLFAKIACITNQTTALDVFKSLSFEEKYLILDLFVHMSTDYDIGNMNIRSHFDETKQQSEEFKKKLK